MAKHEEREKVLALRKKGFSYSQIKEKVTVSKSTLSNWLKDMPLSTKRMSELRDNSPKRIESFRQTMRKKREKILLQRIFEEKKKVGKISKRDLYIIGLALYWAEGTKTWDSKIEVTNSDPMLLQVFLRWLKAEKADIGRARIKLHLYEGMNIKKEMSFWSNSLEISLEQFYQPIIKETRRRFHRGSHGHGTCQLIYGDRVLNDRIYAGIRHLSSLDRRVE